MLEKYQNIYQEYQNTPLTNVEEICKKYGVSKSSYYNALKKEGIKNIKKDFFTTCPIEKLEEAVNLYQSGLSIIKVTQQLNMGEKTLSKYLKYLNIDIRDRRKHRNDLSYDKSYFNKIDTEEKAYWYGFIMADGSLWDGKSPHLCIEVNGIDYHHLEKFRDSIKSNHDIAFRKKRNMCRIEVCSKEIAEDLKILGCVSNKTENGFINLDKLPLDLIRHFLRGYLDGDGYIDKTRYRVIYTVKSFIIVNQLQEMFSKFDINMDILPDKTYFRLKTERKNIFYKILKLLYSDSNIYLDRKFEIYQKRINEN